MIQLIFTVESQNGHDKFFALRKRNLSKFIIISFSIIHYSSLGCFILQCNIAPEGLGKGSQPFQWLVGIAIGNACLQVRNILQWVFCTFPLFVLLLWSREKTMIQLSQAVFYHESYELHEFPTPYSCNHEFGSHTALLP